MNFAKNDLDIDYNSYVQQDHSPDGEVEIDIDISGVESDIRTSLESNLSDFNKSVLELIEFDISKIVSKLDLERMTADFLESYEPYDDDDINSSYKTSQPYQDNIDSIFER